MRLAVGKRKVLLPGLGIGAHQILHPAGEICLVPAIVAGRIAVLSNGGRLAGVVDFSDRDEFESWLRTQPKEVSVVIAARAVLRVLPQLSELITKEEVDLVVLPVFRFAALTWIVATNSSSKKEIKELLLLVGISAKAFHTSFAASSSLVSAVSSAAATVLAVTPLDAYIDAAETIANVDTADTAAEFTIYFDSAYADDAAQIEAGRAVSIIAKMPLWRENAPDGLLNQWKRLKEKLLRLNEDWGVWTDWYEARLYGSPAPIERLELARTTIENDIWEQGPAKVNAHIKKLIQKHTPKRDLGQRLAPYSFYAKDGKILARPLEGHPYSPDMTEDMRTDLKRKIHDLLARLTSTQAPQRLLDTLGRFDAVLGDDLDAVKPGLLLSISRSLAADINAYDTSEGRAELAEDAFSHMTDVLASLTDLKACYPEIAKLEAATLAQKMTGGMADKFMEQSDKIIEAAEQNPSSISKQAIEGLKALLPDIEDLREIIRFEKDDQKLADAREKIGKLVALHSLTLRNYTAKVISEAKRTGIAYTKEFRENADSATRAATIAGVVFLFANPVAAIAVLGLSAWAQLPKEIDKLKEGGQDSDPLDDKDDTGA